MTVDELKEYYEDLLILQYRNGTKSRGTIGAMVGEVIADMVSQNVRDAFDLDFAVGAQLDVLGAYRGVPRTLFGFNLTKTYFEMPDHNDPNLGTAMGFASANMSDGSITWYWLRAQDINAVAYTMNDNEYRAVIKFAVATQSSSLTLSEIDDICFDFFGAYVTLSDPGTMAIVYNDSPSDPSNLFALVNQAGLLPKPAGVSISVTNI